MDYYYVGLIMNGVLKRVRGVGGCAMRRGNCCVTMVLILGIVSFDLSLET